MKRQTILLTAFAAAFSIAPAMAETAGTWTVGAGVGYVDPDSDNGTLGNGAYKVKVDDDARTTFTAEYFPMDNVGVEVLAAIPFRHDITLQDGSGSVIEAKTQHLPPTVSLQYHFDGYSNIVKPFIGVGANYTAFFNESIATGADLDIDDSWGVAGHAGLDFKVNDTDAVRVDARYIDLEPDVELDGADIGTVEINPWVYGVSYVQRF